MNAIDLLKEQHEEVKALFERFEDADGEAEKLSLFKELADTLAAHTTIEEKVFYPAAYAAKTKDLLMEAVEEHLAMKRIIADLLDLPANHESFDAKIKVLKEQMEHHVGEEEEELFEAARKELSRPELERLGREMVSLFDSEMKADPSAGIPGETAEAAPIN